MTDLKPGDRVRILGLDGKLRTLKYTIVDHPGNHPDWYTTIVNDCGGQVRVLTTHLRKIEETHV